jgi:hypothetical protein
LLLMFKDLVWDLDCFSFMKHGIQIHNLGTCSFRVCSRSIFLLSKVQNLETCLFCVSSRSIILLSKVHNNIIWIHVSFIHCIQSGCTSAVVSKKEGLAY